MVSLNDRKRAAQIAHDLMVAFVWSDTPEGQDYWDDVYMNLLAYQPDGFVAINRDHEFNEE